MTTTPSENPPAALDGALWRSITTQLANLEELVTGPEAPGSIQERAEGWRYLLRFLEAGIRSCLAAGDADYPEFTRMIENSMSWGLDNPDCNYSYARIRGDARYRVGGRIGSARHLEIQVNTGHFGDGNVGGWRTVSSLILDEIKRDANGNFEILLGSEPDPAAQNHMLINEQASFVFVRQYMENWDVERPADLFIERVAAELPRPALTPATLEARVQDLLQWLDKGARGWAGMARLVHAAPLQAITMTPPLVGNAGLRGQSYGMGHYRCAADEALILEFKPPACRMWGIQLCNTWWESMEFATRQTSLNSHQARLDPDGLFRGVVAHHDPGFANWIDCEGHVDGTIAVRYLFPDAVNQPALRVVALGDLQREMPADSPRTTREERRLVLERRSRAVQLRYRY